MSQSSRVQLTQSAETRLSSVLQAYREELMHVLEREKFVPGEEVTEATAADVDLAVRRLRQGKTRLIEIRRLSAQLMLLIAGIMVTAGLIYPHLSDLLQNRTQMILIASGLYIGLMALFMYRMMSIRYGRERDAASDLGERIANLERALRERHNEGNTISRE